MINTSLHIGVENQTGDPIEVQVKDLALEMGIVITNNPAQVRDLALEMGFVVLNNTAQVRDLALEVGYIEP